MMLIYNIINDENLINFNYVYEQNKIFKYPV